MMTALWVLLGMVSIVALISSFFIGKNAIWGGLTIGILIGVITALVYLILGRGFYWLMILKIGIVGTLCGLVAELMGMIGDKLKKS